MSGTTVVRGNAFKSNLYQLTLSPVLVAPNTTTEQTFTVNGLSINDWVDVESIGAQQAGLSVGNTRVSATNTLAVSFTNATSASITPTATASYLLLHMISEYQPLQTVP
jgi:hypothetical protein